MLDKESIINTAKRYAEVVAKEFSPSAVVLFGSHVNGMPGDDSDIDVGVVFDNFTGDWLETSAKLWRLRHDVSIDIEPHLLDSSNDKSGFVKHVLKTGRIVYRA